MGDEWKENPQPANGADQPNQDDVGDIDKRLEEIKRTVVQRASEYWQKTQTPITPQQASSEEEQRIRQLANMWSNENWRIARELGTYMNLVSWSVDEVWEITVQTRLETRTMETVTEPYTGKPLAKPQIL